MQNISHNGQSTATQMVKTALNIVCTHHEVQLEKFNRLLNNNNDKEFDRLAEIFDQFSEINDSKELAFRSFLHFLCE